MGAGAPAEMCTLLDDEPGKAHWSSRDSGAQGPRIQAET